MKLQLLRRQSGGYATFGCMWEQSSCHVGEDFVCTNAEGKAVPIQSRVTAYWPDGSIKWTAHTGSTADLGE